MQSFSLSLLRFLNHMYLCVLQKMTMLRTCHYVVVVISHP